MIDYYRYDCNLYLALEEDIPNTPIKFSVRVPVKSLSRLYIMSSTYRYVCNFGIFQNNSTANEKHLNYLIPVILPLI